MVRRISARKSVGPPTGRKRYSQAARKSAPVTTFPMFTAARKTPARRQRHTTSTRQKPRLSRTYISIYLRYIFPFLTSVCTTELYTVYSWRGCSARNQAPSKEHRLAAAKAAVPASRSRNHPGFLARRPLPKLRSRRATRGRRSSPYRPI